MASNKLQPDENASSLVQRRIITRRPCRYSERVDSWNESLFLERRASTPSREFGAPRDARRNRRVGKETSVVPRRLTRLNFISLGAYLESRHNENAIERRALRRRDSLREPRGEIAEYGYHFSASPVAPEGSITTFYCISISFPWRERRKKGTSVSRKEARGPGAKLPGPGLFGKLPTRLRG